MNRTAFLGVLAVSVLALAGCGKDEDNPKGQGKEQPKGAEPVLIYTAASARDVIGQLAETFSKDTNVQVKVNPDASSRLAAQIIQGAPADLFLSASEEWGEAVKDKDLAELTQPLLGNTLVIVVPKGNPGKIARASDLSKVKRLALAGPEGPAGRYARQALKSLGLLYDLEKRKQIVSGDDVRAALAFVERGEAEAGVVYATDARISDKVDAVYNFSPRSHDPIRYPLILLKQGAARKEAREFYDFLLTDRAAAVFEKYGFKRLEEKKDG